MQDGGQLNTAAADATHRPFLAASASAPYATWSENGYLVYAAHWAGQVGGAAVRGEDIVPVPTLTPTPTPTRVPTEAPTAAATPTATPTQTAAGSGLVDLKGARILAYPNPARGRVTFAWNEPDATAVRVEIYNLAGQKVAQVKGSDLTGNVIAWTTGDTAPGIYFYRIILTVNGREEAQGMKKLAILK